MAKRNLIEQLDRAVDAIMAAPDGADPNVFLSGGPSDGMDPSLAPLIRIAADLRHLPREDFRAHLESQLLPDSPAGVGETCKETPELKPAGQPVTDGDGKPTLMAHDIGAALDALSGMSERVLASMNRSTVGVRRFASQAPLWERHLDGDELLHVLEGELDVTTLTDRGPVRTNVPAGSLFVCPRGMWHWPRANSPVSVLYVTPGEGTERSSSKEPRHRSTQTKQRETSHEKEPAMLAHDVRFVASGLKRLAISSSTTEEEADAAFRQLGSLDQCGLYVGSFSGMSPWERHSAGDELLHILDGEIDITVLTDDGPFQTTVRPGSVFVCPEGLWHRQYSRRGATVLSATPQPTEISFAQDPRPDRLSMG